MIAHPDDLFIYIILYIIKLALTLSVDHQSQHHFNREMGPAMFYMYKCTRDTSAMQGIYKQVLGGGSACNGSSVRKHVGREGRAGLLPGRGGALHQPHINQISTYLLPGRGSALHQPHINSFQLLLQCQHQIGSRNPEYFSSISWIEWSLQYVRLFVGYYAFVFIGLSFMCLRLACLGFVLYCPI